jgi:hypothetical protein
MGRAGSGWPPRAEGESGARMSSASNVAATKEAAGRGLERRGVELATRECAAVRLEAKGKAMAKVSVRLIGEDSSRVLETTAGNETIDGLARHLTETGYLLGKMKTSERMPEPQDVAILASQVKWISVIAAPERRA